VISGSVKISCCGKIPSCGISSCEMIPSSSCCEIPSSSCCGCGKIPSSCGSVDIVVEIELPLSGFILDGSNNTGGFVELELELVELELVELEVELELSLTVASILLDHLDP
jgi:hypothetical protein